MHESLQGFLQGSKKISRGQALGAEVSQGQILRFRREMSLPFSRFVLLRMLDLNGFVQLPLASFSFLASFGDIFWFPKTNIDRTEAIKLGEHQSSAVRHPV